MKKVFVGIAAVLLGLMLIISPSVKAAQNPENLTAATGSFNLTKLVHANKNPESASFPNFTFEFEKNAVTGTPEGGDIQNVVANMPTIASASTVSNGWTDATGTEINDEYTYNAKQTVSANFTFTEVGTYTYKVKEASNNNSNITNDNTEYSITFDVAKRDTNEDGVYDALYVPVVLIRNITDENKKVDTIDFENFVEGLSDIYVEKEVTGTKGDTTKYFSFNLLVSSEGNHNYVIEEKVNGNWTAVSGADAQGTIVGGTAKTIQLKHGQRVHVQNLLIGSTYSVTESSNDDYMTFIKRAGVANEVPGSSVTDEVVKEEGNEVKFINLREDLIDINTGVSVNVVPYIVIVLVAGLGIFFVAKDRSRRTEE